MTIPKATATFKRTELAAILARVCDTAPNRSPKAILTNVMISVNGNVEFKATDLDRWHAEYHMPERSGEINVLVDAKRLRKAVTSSKAKQLTLEFSEDGVKIAGQHIPTGGDVSEYPYEVSRPEIVARRDLDAGVMIRMLERTIFACDTESSRYALGGVLIEMDKPLATDANNGTTPDYIRLVGTDGRRLATDYEGHHCGELVSAILPVTACKGLLKALKKAESLCLCITERGEIDCTVHLKCGGSIGYRFRTMEGRFPKWRDVMPNESQFPPVCMIDANRWTEQLTAALASTDEDSRGADVCSADDLLTVCTLSETNGKYFGDIDVSSRGNKLDVTLDCRFLLDWSKVNKGKILQLRAMDVEQETKRNKQCDHCVLIQCERADYIVMPLSRDRK